MIFKTIVLSGVGFLLFGCGQAGVDLPTSVQNEMTIAENGSFHIADVNRPVWADDILPIMQKHCVNCHKAQSTLGNYADYRVVSRKKDPIYERVVVTRNMPTPGLPKMTDEEINLVAQWIQAGAPKE